jgi:hypothetical protein
MTDLFISPGGWWLIAAVVLGLLELAAPGVFLVFLAAAAAVTGAVLLLFPDLSLPLQLLSFAGWSAIAVFVGRRLYTGNPVDSADPLLNDRVARLVGDIVIVTQAIEDGRGRVRVGDSEWPARGADAPVGARVRIAGGQAGVLEVTPLPAIESH